MSYYSGGTSTTPRFFLVSRQTIPRSQNGLIAGIQGSSISEAALKAYKAIANLIGEY
jgi:hypothetical protein